jgi:hypothetical protein
MAFNDHLSEPLFPDKYLVVDETINQWLVTGMPNLKKVLRKPHLIRQEFKAVANYDTNCLSCLDTVSDPCAREYDNDEGVRNLTATVKRLVKPWFGSGRTVIADSWFGSPQMITMLSGLGLYSIMQVTKRRFWPRGMPSVDIVSQLESPYGSSYTMHKFDGQGNKFFLCAYRDQKAKALVSSGSTTRIAGERHFVDNSRQVVIKRSEVFEEYETHKSKK